MNETHIEPEEKIPDSIRNRKTFKNLVGKKFGRLTVLEHAGSVLEPRGKPAHSWLCKCLCGKEAIVRRGALTSGHTKSCGCLMRERSVESNTTHGATRRGNSTPEYRAWRNVLVRCTNSKIPQWMDYGGRGITICGRWSDSFENFLSDMGERPTPNHSIERIDNDAGYSKENCRWASRNDQCRNKRNNVWITFNGETLCLADWSKRTGFSATVIRKRIRSGWSVYKTLTKPIRIW